MCSEEKIMRQIFNGAKWKDKYFVDWCDLCNVAIISCEACGGTTCNCHACEKCSKDFDEFFKLKRHVEDYLTEEEKLIYQKCLRIKKHMIGSLSKGESEINWQKMYEQGKFSRWEEELFKKELKS